MESFVDGESNNGYDISSFSDQAKNNISEITEFLLATLSDIPDDNLVDDWRYLCEMIKTDLAVKPEKALTDLSSILNFIGKADNARTFMISNSADRETVMGEIEGFLAKLNSDSESIRFDYTNNNRVVERLQSRHQGIDKPVYVGLVNEGTRNGVLIFSTKLYDTYDTSDVAVLDCLAGKVFSGYGPHGFFMKTWAAGLAYSNGFRFNQTTGRSRYYAERCPDVSETMKFVVDQIKEAELDPGLSDYAIAQVFRSTRAPSRYEARGEAIAADLADGITPEKVKQHRLSVLKQKYHENLFDKLTDRFEKVYGSVLIGYGPSLSQYKDGNYFLIGPETQFESLEKYIESTENPNTIYRLYPRDFWLTL
jgi:predicted transcriptional regulator with HTH domain